MDLNKAFIKAVRKNDFNKIKDLHNQGADVNAVCKGLVTGGRTPLHFACEYGNIDIVNYLIDNGAGINASIDKDDPTLFPPLASAVYKKRIEVIALLIEKGARLDAKNGVGQTMDEWAKAMGNKQLMEIFGVEKTRKQAAGAVPSNFISPAAVKTGNRISIFIIVRKGPLPADTKTYQDLVFEGCGITGNMSERCLVGLFSDEKADDVYMMTLFFGLAREHGFAVKEDSI